MGPSGKGQVVLRPLDFVQMDHAIVDLIVVDPETREEIGRPWITLAIDVATRCIVGFYLTFDEPSQTSVALALEHSCCPKDDWCKEIGYDGEWIPFGLMKVIGWDNAKCFKAISLVKACRHVGIEPRFRHVRHPVHGAYIERFTGTFMGKIHQTVDSPYELYMDCGIDATGSCTANVYSKVHHFSMQITLYSNDAEVAPQADQIFRTLNHLVESWISK